MKRLRVLSISGSLAVLALAFAAGPRARAATPVERCGSVDFRPVLGKPRDQGFTGWCYAHTAADLVSFRLKKRVSPFDLAAQAMLGDLAALGRSADPAIQGFLRRNPGWLRRTAAGRAEDKSEQNSYNILGRNGLYSIGGNEDAAILLANVKGLCAEENLPTGPKALAQELEEVRVYHLQRSRKERPEALAPIGAVQEKEARKSAHSFLAYVDAHCAPRLKAPTLIPWLYEEAKSVKELRRKFKSGNLSVEANRKKMMGLINRALDAGKPAAIGYDGRELQADVDADDDGDHASVVAARRWDGQRCRYFIRDSYGTDCGQYRAKVRERCEAKNGGVWIREDELKSIFSVVYVRE